MMMSEVDTPALIIDLDAFERNLQLMANFMSASSAQLRPHSKTHKSPIIAQKQIEFGAMGVCCQKVSEAEIMVEGGINDILISNEIVGSQKLARLAKLAGKAQISVCADDSANIKELAIAAQAAGTVISVRVEIDVGASRCGVPPGEAALRLAKQIADSPVLKFDGLQAYNGAGQHVRDHCARNQIATQTVEQTRQTVALMASNGLTCKNVGGAGTGTFQIDGESGVYNELQAGSYIFMDADYAQNLGENGTASTTFEHALFIQSTVMSHPVPTRSVLDAGHKAASIDAGMPTLFGHPNVIYGRPSDEHGVLTLNADARENLPKLADRVLLVPGHCDPTVNLHDWFICIRGLHTSNAQVEAVWPVAARGALF